MTDLVILVPVLNRPHRVEPLLASIAAGTPEPHRVLFACSDPHTVDELDRLNAEYVLDEGGDASTYPRRINRLFHATTEPYVMLAADDLDFHAGWLPAAMALMTDINGVVGTNGLLGAEPVHYLVSRDYINTIGGTGDGIPGVVLFEGYQHTWCDTEFMRVAQHRERFAYATESIVEHLHYISGKAPMDSTYAQGDATMHQGSTVFNSRAHLWQ